MKNKKIILYRVVADFIDIYTVTALLLFIDFLVKNSTLKDYYFVILGYGFLICKDFYNKKGSFGKKIMKLELVFYNNRNITLKKIIRNIFVIIWPVEIIVLFIFNKRIGDFITNSKIRRKK